MEITPRRESPHESTASLPRVAKNRRWQLEEQDITTVLSGEPVVRLGTCKSDLESWGLGRVRTVNSFSTLVLWEEDSFYLLLFLYLIKRCKEGIRLIDYYVNLHLSDSNADNTGFEVLCLKNPQISVSRY